MICLRSSEEVPWFVRSPAWRRMDVLFMDDGEEEEGEGRDGVVLWVSLMQIMRARWWVCGELRGVGLVVVVMEN